MPKLSIDEMLFLMALGRDVDYHDAYPQSTYLDRETGEIVWVYDNDDDATTDIGIKPEENHRKRMAIAARPDRHLKIPGRSHHNPRVGGSSPSSATNKINNLVAYSAFKNPYLSL